MGRRRRFIATMMGGINTALRNAVLSYSPYAYWLLNDIPGSGQATDIVAGYAATKVGGVTFGQPGIGDAYKSALFDGAIGTRLNFSAVTALYDALGAANWKDEGSLLIWADVAYDLARSFKIFMTGGNFQIEIRHREPGYGLQVTRVSTATKTVSYDIAFSGWVGIGASWSVAGDYLRLFVNGARRGTDATLIATATWGSSFLVNRCNIGAYAETGGTVTGKVAHCAILPLLTDARIAGLTQFPPLVI